MIITNKSELRNQVPYTDFKPSEVEVIAASLFTELADRGLGLSANQIGVNKRICVINVKEPIVLVNPRITERSEEQVVYREACLSLPKTMKNPIKTIRNESVTVETDNHGTLDFSPDISSDEWTPQNFWNDLGLLESVVVQHEIDHLNGIIIQDRCLNKPVVGNKYNRNQKYMFMSPDGDIEYVKFKHGQNLLDQGWIIQE